MEENTEKLVISKGKIGNALTSTATNHVVAVSNDIYDEDLGIYQSSLNAKIGNQVLAIFVDSLPVSGPKAGDENKIHLVKKKDELSSINNSYTEYIYNQDAKTWEIIGDSKLKTTYDDKSFTLTLGE